MMTQVAVFDRASRSMVAWPDDTIVSNITTLSGTFDEKIDGNDDYDTSKGRVVRPY